MTTTPTKMASLEEFSAAEQIFNDPRSWKRESERGRASERTPDDDSTPSADFSDSLLGGRRKPKPPSFTLKPFTKRFNLLPVNEPTTSRILTTNSVYPLPLPPDSTPESPFDLEKIYGLDFEDIYGDSDSPLVQSRSGWTGVADKDELERSQIFARIVESSKNVSTEMSQLVKQRMSILLGSGNIFRAFPTPHGFEFDFEGGDFVTPNTGIATGSFARFSPGSLYSSSSDQITTRQSTRLSLKKNLRISTTRTTTTTTVISIDSPSSSSQSSITIISAVSASPYSILDLYGGSPARTGRTQSSPKTAGLLTSSSRPPHSSSQSLVPKTSHPTTTTFSAISVPLPSTGSRSAVATKFSLAQLTTVDSFLPNEPAKIVEIPDDTATPAMSTIKKPSPTLSIVTSVPSRLAYKRNETKKIAPLAVTKKEVKHTRPASPRPLPKIPHAQTPPPPVPALPATVTVHSLPEPPTGPLKQTSSFLSSKVAPPNTTGSQSRIPIRKRSAQTSLPPSPTTDNKVMGFEAKIRAEQGKDETSTREPRTQNRAKVSKLRSATPPPRGSRPPKKKPALSPVPALFPNEVHNTTPTVPTLPPTSPSTDKVAVTPSADVIASTLSPPTAALSPAMVSPTSSSASTYPSPSMFPLPPANVPQTDPSQYEIAPSTDVAASTAIQAPDPSATELLRDRVDARSSSASSNTVVEGRMDDIDKDTRVVTGPTADPPIIHVSVDLVKDSPLMSDVVEVLPSTTDESTDAVRARDEPKSRNPSLIMSTTSVADLVEDAYAHGIPPVDENSAEVMLLRADSPDSGSLGLSQSTTETFSTRVQHVRFTSLLAPEGSEVSLLRSDSKSSRTRSASDAGDEAAQVKRGNSLRHSRSAVQLGSKKDTSLRSLFEREVPLPDRSLLAKRTRVPSIDARPLVSDAFGPGVQAPGITGSKSPGGGSSTWNAPREWDVQSMSAPKPTTLPVVSDPKPERPPRSQTPRIPSQVLTMGVLTNSSEPSSSSRPGSSRSSSSSEKLLQTKLLSEAKESHSSPLIGKSMTSSQHVGVAVADEVVLPVAVPVPSSRSLTPVSFGKLPSAPSFTNARTHRRSVSEKLTQSTISELAKRERKRAPTPMLSERMPISRSASVEESVPSFPNVNTSSIKADELDPGTLSSRLQARRAPTPIALQGRPVPSADSPSSIAPDVLSSKVPVRRAPTPTPSDRVAVPSTDMPLPPLPKPTGTTFPRSSPTHPPKASVDRQTGNEPSRRRAPTPTPSDRKRLPSDAPLPPVPSAAHPPSNVPQPTLLHVEGVGRTPLPTLLSRSRSGSVVNKDLPIPPVPSVPKVSPRSTPTHSPSTSLDYNSDAVVRRAPTPSGSRPPLPPSNLPFPDPSVLAKRYRKPSISAVSRDAYASASSSSTVNSGSGEPSVRRFAQPTISAKLKQTFADPSRDRLTSEPSPYTGSGSGRSMVGPPPLPPKAESRGRMRARPQSPVGGGGRARSVPRKVGERGVVFESMPVPSSGDRKMRGRPSSPTGERGRSSRSDADIRGGGGGLLHARSRSVGPALAETTVKGRKRTSSLSVAPPPLPNHTLFPPSRSPLRALSPSQGAIRGRVSPFPVTPASASSSLKSRPLSRALTSF